MRSNKNKHLALAATAGAVTQVAGAAIITADFSSAPITISRLDAIFIDFETGTAMTSEFAGYDAAISFTNSLAEKPTLATFFNFRSDQVSGNYVKKLSFGDTIALGSQYGEFEHNDLGPWNTPNDGLGYVGIQNAFTGNQAWLYVNYNDTANTISLVGLGYNTSGTLTAGQTSAIPEPAAATALAALLAGGMAAFQRRRRAA